MTILGRHLYVGALIMVLAGALPASADDAIDVEKQNAIIKLMEITDMVDITQQTISTGLTASFEQIVKKNPNLSGAARDIIVEEFNQVAIDINPEIIALTAEQFDTYFTKDEIDQVIAFYESPVGRKMVDLTPEIMTQTQTRLAELLVPAAQAALVRINERLMERGEDLVL